ncbi:MAG: FAD-binding protein [Bacillota bacterium]
MGQLIPWDKESDVIIVGYGGAGAAAAIEAHDAGARVLILEKTSSSGGNTRISGGIVYAANTSVQKAGGVDDPVEEALKYMLAAADGLADEDRVRFNGEKSSEVIEWLTGLGAKFSPEMIYCSGLEESPQYTQITPPAPRGHIVQELTGEGLMVPLDKAVRDRGIEVMFDCPVQELVVDPGNGVVSGVRTAQLNIKANKAVIITTGGFSRNEEMAKNYLTAYIGSYPGSAMSIRGDGIRMAQALGADMRNMGLLEPLLGGVPFGPPSFDEFMVQAVPVITVVGYAPCILVNKQGRRFIDEYAHYTILGPKLALELEGQVAYCIFDENVRKMGGSRILAPFLSDDLSEEIRQGIIKTGNNPCELAAKIGVDEGVLEDTIYTYNENAEQGTDPEYNRAKFLAPLNTPPFYAMEYKPSFFLTAGGLKIDLNSRVINVSGKPIPGLYAAGETTGGFIGKHYASGYCLLNAFVTGRTAGQHAAT